MPVDPSLLASFEPLRSMRPETLARLAGSARTAEFQRGAYLFRRDEAARDAVFLMLGTVELLGEKGALVRRLRAEDDAARQRLAHQSPRRLAARCVTRARCLLIDAALLDVMLTWDQHGLLEVDEPSATADTELKVPTGDWMMALLHTPLFQRLPAASLQGLFLRLQPIDVACDDQIIAQGDEGEYFYVLTAGRCQVTRRSPTGAELLLAELEPGACFGEEALIADAQRNASVRMLSAGRLMRLHRADFRELLKMPLLRYLSLWQARRAMSAGGLRWLDVRTPSEFANGHLPHALNLPLHLLRRQMHALDRTLKYVCYCDTGRRSGVAAFVLGNAGIETYVLERGWNADDA